LCLSLLIFPVLSYVNVAEIATCSQDCTVYQGKFLSSRLWSLQTEATFTIDDVSQTFEDGLAPTLTQLNGFNEYVGSPLTGSGNNTDLGIPNSNLIVFYNIFDTEVEGANANSLAQSFRNNGVLNYQINPISNYFGVGTIDFFIRSIDTCQVRLDSLFLSTRLWDIVEGSGLTPSDVTQMFLAGFAPQLESQPGFVQYAGVARTDGKALFYSVFETEDLANAANALAVAFHQNNPVLSTGIVREIFTVSEVDFDFVCTSPQDSSNSKPCTSACKSFTGKRFGSRLWQKSQPQLLGYSNAQVVDELLASVAPIVTQLDGFNTYYGVVLEDPNLSFFFNVFDTAASAAEAQAAVVYIQANGILSTEIVKDRFEKGYYQFHFTHPRACVVVGDGAYMATRLWQFQAGASYTASQVVDTFRTGFGPIISQQSGFLEYAGIVLDGGDNPGLPFFYNVFQSYDGAQESLTLAKQFVANGVLASQITMLDFEFGNVTYEYQCQYRDVSCPAVSSCGSVPCNPVPCTPCNGYGNGRPKSGDGGTSINFNFADMLGNY